MPAAAVIPAPRAYIIVVAVKTCVVDLECLLQVEPRPCGVGLTAKCGLIRSLAVAVGRRAEQHPSLADGSPLGLAASEVTSNKAERLR